MNTLDALFWPKSIAVIGASNRPLTIGHRIITNLLRYKFTGRIHPINPKAEPILELPTYHSILDVPGEVDMAHVIVRNDLVGKTLEDCATKGVKVAVINTSGFKEMGSDGARMEQELVDIGRRSGLRLFGPNCQGVMNSDPQVSLYSNFTFATMRPGHVSLVAQGGGLAEVINNYFGMNQVGQRMYASNGNACDISVPEIIEYYGQDPETHVIVLHLESFPNPREFLERVAPVASGKPVLALKSGTTAEGARAVSSHTGGLVQQDTLTDVLFDRCGVLRFSDVNQLCDAAAAFATQKVPRGNRIGLVTNAGSPAIIVTDEAVKRGMQVPDLSPGSKDFLKGKLQSMAATGNPIDMMATASGTEFGFSLQALLDDPNIDSAVVCFMTPFFVETLGIAQAIEDKVKTTEKTVLAVAMTNPEEKPEWKQTIEKVRQAGVPVYYFPEAAARVLSTMNEYRRLQQRPRQAPPDFAVDRESATLVLQKSVLNADGFMSPADAGKLLKAYGIDLVMERRATSGEAIRAAAEQIGYPVVLKAEAPSLVHKTESEAVATNLKTELELLAAFRGMHKRLSKVEQLGFVVQKHLDRGLEVIVGGAKAPGVGAMVMFGLGGIHVEVFHDVVFKLAPLCDAEAREMLEAIRGRALLDGVRKQKSMDREALAELLVRVSRLLTDFPQIGELDLNPVMAYPKGIKTQVVDARIRLRQS